MTQRGEPAVTRHAAGDGAVVDGEGALGWPGDPHEGSGLGWPADAGTEPPRREP